MLLQVQGLGLNKRNCILRYRKKSIPIENESAIQRVSCQKHLGTGKENQNQIPNKISPIK